MLVAQIDKQFNEQMSSVARGEIKKFDSGKTPIANPNSKPIPEDDTQYKEGLSTGEKFMFE